jgi:hypothetical protein
VLATKERFMRALKCVVAALAVIVSLSAGNAIAGNTYKVSAEITEHGITVATPTLVVKAGAPASVEIAGDKGYRLTVQVQPAELGTVDVAARAETAAGKVDSTLTGNLDTPMTVATGDIGLKITVTPGGG